MSAIYNLHKQHGKLSDFQDLILDLNMLMFPKSSMERGKNSNIYVPREDIVSEA